MKGLVLIEFKIQSLITIIKMSKFFNLNKEDITYFY